MRSFGIPTSRHHVHRLARDGRRRHEGRGRPLKHVHLELGGKNAIIVMDDADLDLAVDGICWSAFGTAGPALHRGVARHRPPPVSPHERHFSTIQAASPAGESFNP